MCRSLARVRKPTRQRTTFADRMHFAPTGVEPLTFALIIRSYCNRIAGSGLTVKAESL